MTVDEQHEVNLDIERWGDLARAVLRHEGIVGGAELSLFFIDTPAMTELNGEFMDETGPTDVLAFPIDADDEPISDGEGLVGGTGAGEPPQLLGDVLICPQVAESNARERSVRLEDEIALLVVHGILHVLGHDHAEPDEQALMRSREREMLDLYHRREE